MIRLYAIALAACVAAVGVSYTIGRVQGYERGQAATEARVAEARAEAQDALHAVSDRLSEALAANRSLERQAAATRRAFESATDPDSCRADPDSLRRLEQRFGPAEP